MCDNEVSYTQSTLTFYDEFEIELPINEEKTIILRSMLDVDTKSIKQTADMRCTIYNEALKIAKPMQFPNNNFYELTNIEEKDPVSLLFAHLYYGHNSTGTFEDIIYELCDIVDDILIPYCKYSNNIKFELSGCTNKNHINRINYLNCRTIDEDEIPTSVDCNFIIHNTFKGYVSNLFTFLTLVIEIAFLVLLIIHRKEKCIFIAGFDFLLVIFITNLGITISSFFWIGEISKIKCTLRIWFLILNITCFICSYTTKSIIIISIYNNKKLTSNTVNNNNIFTTFISVVFVQIIFLIIWTFTSQKFDYLEKKIPNVGVYYDKVCSKGNKELFYSIFTINLILAIISIFHSYQGRNIPDEFNDSRKIFNSSLITSLQIIMSSIAISNKNNNLWVQLFVLIMIDFTALVNIIIYIIPKLLTIYNISMDTTSNIIIRNSKQNENLSFEVSNSF
ncbi:hypothetical protein LY90DRAFT_179256 [Neocallimastix californiae]|uniref:G-protein coupled receptors family 3 profile domain-containing protein n=1 Tax=Neocallimastix californiae TaxID=1754190 RepID=A0A1Y2EPN4_9FUNG|nr:hypothetical protein LY90DRAFT_179256 [Neocallimastix californiae]|eukprot:ORY73156.1 hypothetical protein LY90DRAFT_179256 [Neocallimastix californiae]